MGGRERERERERDSFVMRRGWQAAESYHNAGDKTLRREVTSMVEETNLLDLNEGIGSGGMSPFTKVTHPTERARERQRERERERDRERERERDRQTDQHPSPRRLAVGSYG